MFPLDFSFGVSSFISRTTSAGETEIRCSKSSISCIQKLCCVWWEIVGGDVSGVSDTLASVECVAS